jgi:hypothetical protein
LQIVGFEQWNASCGAKKSSLDHDFGVRSILASLGISQIMPESTLGFLCVPWQAAQLKIIFLHRIWLMNLC